MKTALVNGVPSSGNQEEDTSDNKKTTTTTTTSSLVHPVPTNDDVNNIGDGDGDDEGDGEIPKTLLETARQGSTDSSLA